MVCRGPGGDVDYLRSWGSVPAIGRRTVGFMRGSGHRLLRFFLNVSAWFNLLSAMVGAVGLVAFEGMGIPAQWLNGTPFDSFLWPGLLLGVVVGGTQALALFALHGHFRLAPGMSVAAGLVMMTWIFAEIAMMLVWSPLHGVFFASGLAQVVVGVLALGAWPSPLLARDRL